MNELFYFASAGSYFWLLDIFGVEDVFQVHPRLLEYEPLINASAVGEEWRYNRAQPSEFLLPCFDFDIVTSSLISATYFEPIDV